MADIENPAGAYDPGYVAKRNLVAAIQSIEYIEKTRYSSLALTSAEEALLWLEADVRKKNGERIMAEAAGRI